MSASKHFFRASAKDFKKIPSSPIVYWVSDAITRLFDNKLIGSLHEVREGLGTRDDDIFLRRFWEISLEKFRRKVTTQHPEPMSL